MTQSRLLRSSTAMPTPTSTPSLTPRKRGPGRPRKVPPSAQHSECNEAEVELEDEVELEAMDALRCDFELGFGQEPPATPQTVALNEPAQSPASPGTGSSGVGASPPLAKRRKAIRKPRLQATCWYFLAKDPSEDTVAKCMVCNAVIARSDSNTKGLNNHCKTHVQQW